MDVNQANELCKFVKLNNFNNAENLLLSSLFDHAI